jgi:hypothetical protein
MAYDSARQRVVFFGGTTGMETWEYGPITGCSQSTSVKEFVPRGGTDATSAVAALGARDGHTVSLGLGGVLVVRMSPPIASGPGTDFIVYAKGAHDGGIDETYRVEASTDNVHWAFVRDCPGGECPLDLAATDLTYARWVRITDLSPQEEGSDFPTVGVDIDAVVATRCAEECSIALLAPVDGATFTWSGPSPTFTWSSTCEATYQVEFSNSREFEHPALFVLPAHPLHQTSFTPNHGNWTAIGNLAKNRGGTGTVYWRVGGYGSDDEVIRSPASSFKIDWRPRH